MKRMMMVTALAVSSVGCVADTGDASVRLLGARALEGTTAAECEVGTRQRAAGELDVSAGNSYVLGLNIESRIVPPSTIIGGKPFTNEGLNDVVLDQLVVSYTTQPPLGLPKEERIPLYFVLRPGTADDSYMLAPSVGPQALEALQGALAPGDTATLLATVQAKGKLNSGQLVETNEITFPITVRSSGFNPATGLCPSGAAPTVVGPCGLLGQDQGPICP